MKKAMVIFVIIFLVTALIPLLSMVKPQSNDKEVVTIFNSASTSTRGIVDGL